MEETLGNVPGARQIFERWMEWEPGEQAWQTYINFEMRYKEVDRARHIWQRFLHVHSDPKNWIRCRFSVWFHCYNIVCFLPDMPISNRETAT